MVKLNLIKTPNISLSPFISPSFSSLLFFSENKNVFYFFSCNTNEHNCSCFFIHFLNPFPFSWTNKFLSLPHPQRHPIYLCPSFTLLGTSQTHPSRTTHEVSSSLKGHYFCFVFNFTFLLLYCRFWNSRISKLANL